MAYSNYGAYVWKNGKDITKETCDKDYIWKNNKWELQKYENDLSIHKKDEESLVAFGHAVVPLSEDIVIEFYKTFGVKIYIKDKCTILDFETDIAQRSHFELEGITLVGFHLDSYENINFIEIEYNENMWCVVLGSGFGKGYDNYNVSKFVKKHIKFSDGKGDFRKGYRIRKFNNLDLNTELIIDYMERKDDRNYIKYCIWNFAVKPLFKSLIKFDLYGVAFNFTELLEKLWELYYSR